MGEGTVDTSGVTGAVAGGCACGCLVLVGAAFDELGAGATMLAVGSLSLAAKVCVVKGVWLLLALRPAVMIADV